MSTLDAEIATVREFFAALSRGDLDAAFARARHDMLIDVRNSHAPWSGVYRGQQENRAVLAQLTDAWEELRWEPAEIEAAPAGRLVCRSRLRGRGRGSGIEVDASGGWLITLRDGVVSEGVLFQTVDETWRSARARAFADARLYFVCEARPDDRDPGELLKAALRGGVQAVQLRDKDLSDEALVEAARPFRAAASAHRALFILNDRPELVGATGADGVHVGQDDAPVDEARRGAGPASVVGLSTHSPDQVDAARAAGGDARPEQISVGPVWETPTKQGRPATGLELVRHAAAADDPPWFAIGGIDRRTVGEVVAAGARRVVVVRAIRDAGDPEQAARELRAALGAELDS